MTDKAKNRDHCALKSPIDREVDGDKLALVVAIDNAGKLRWRVRITAPGGSFDVVTE